MHWIMMFASFMACEEKKQEAPDISITNTETCGGTAPVIEELSCENTGLDFYPDANADLPTFTLRANITDADADLTSYTMLIKFDSTLDNALDEDAQELTVTGSMSSNACAVSEGDVGAKIFMQGGPPDFSTTFEWYVSIMDAAGDRSETEMIVCTTPDEQGEGDPYQ